MEFRFQKRRGIGNVITTLIILIASVVLGAGVIFFGGSMFQSNTQSEQIKVSNVHSWVASNDTATTAFVIQNTGSKAVTISSITLRGISAPTADWFSNTDPLVVTATNIQTELPADYTESSVVIGGTARTLTSGSVSLAQGAAAIVYVHEAGTINSIDSGNTFALQIQAGQATAVQQVSVVTK